MSDETFDGCLNMWGECVTHYVGSHICSRQDEHDGRCRCACGATTTHKDPIFDDAEELEEAREALDG